MKKFVQTLILLIVTSAVFYTGAGVTIMKYCCTPCSEQSSFIPTSHNCACCLDSSHVNNPSDYCETSSDEHVGCGHTNDIAVTKDLHCSSTRLSIDIDASTSKPLIAMPYVWLSQFVGLSASSVISDNSVQIKSCLNSEHSFFSPPRAYLSKIRVLII